MNATEHLKLRSHICEAVGERRWADFDIPTPLPRVCSHICGADAGGSDISWGQRWLGPRSFEVDAENWVLDPFVAVRILLPLRDRVCVNACNDLCWSQFSARLHPRPLRACVNVPLDDKSTLVHVMAWCCQPTSQAITQHLYSTKLNSSPLSVAGNDMVRSGNKPLPEPMLTQIYVNIWCH